MAIETVGYITIANNNNLETVHLLGLTCATGDIQLISNVALTDISMPLLFRAESLDILSSPGLTGINFPSLFNLAGLLRLYNLETLESVEFPSLFGIGDMIISVNPSLTTLTLPMGSANTMQIDNHVALTDISFPFLSTANVLHVLFNASLVNVNLPILSTVQSNLTVNNNIGLTSIDLSSLLNVSGELVVNYNANLENIQLNSSLSSLNMTFSYNALSEESIDNILANIDSAGYSGGSLVLTGGTNAAPSAVGTINLLNLINKNWTVSVNDPSLILHDDVGATYAGSASYTSRMNIVSVYDNPNLSEIWLQNATSSNILEIYGNALLNTIKIDTMGYVYHFSIKDNPSLSILNLGSFYSCYSDLVLEFNDSLTEFNIPLLSTVAYCNIRNNISLNRFYAPSMTTILGNFNVYYNQSMTYLDMMSLTSTSNNFGQINFFQNDSLQYIGLSALESAYTIYMYNNVSLTEIFLPNLATCNSLNIYSNSSLTALDLYSLVDINTLQIYSNNSLSYIDIGSLTTVTNVLNISNNTLLSLVDIGSLNYVNYLAVSDNTNLAILNASGLTASVNIHILDNDSLINIDLQSLETITDILINDNIILTTVNLSSLTNASGSVRLQGSSVAIMAFNFLETAFAVEIVANLVPLALSLPVLNSAIINIQGNTIPLVDLTALMSSGSVTIVNNTGLTSVLFNSSIACVDFNLSNNAFSQLVVDNILNAIDQAGFASGVINLSGGTNSTPSPAGMVSVGNLTGKSWTVSVN